MHRQSKNPALLFIMTMFAFFGMLSVEAKEVTTSDFGVFDDAVRSADVDTINITGNMTMVTTVFDRKQQSDNLTINGNNYTITAADDLRYSNGVFNNNGKILTINDLTLENFTPRVWSTGVDSSDSTIFNQVKGSLTLSNVTIQNNTNTTLSSNSDLTISNSKFINNKYVKSTVAGGAITTNKKDSTISNTLFQGNKSLKNGGAILHKGPLLILTGGSFEDNEATEMGGAICANSYAKLDIDGTSFKNNTSATKDGGAIAINNSSTSVIKNASFDGNKALGTDAAGGAIALIKGTLSIDNTNFTNNQSNYGGAVYQYTNKNVAMDIKNSTFDSNIAKNGGGALGIFKEAKISGSKFINNKAETEDGGAIFLGAESVTNIDNTIFNGNTAATDGGTITTRDYNANNSAAKLDIVNSTFTSNTATTNGGAINNYFYISAENGEFVTIKETTFDGNSAKNGGAVYNHGVADLNGKYGSIKADNVTFTNNTASNYGGAIYNEGNLDISNSKFTSNKAGNWGGAIYANTTVTNASGTKENNGGVINISNTEFDGNSASIGGAIFLHNGTMNITNSKFTNNSADYSGAIFTGSTEHAILNISDSLFEGNTAKGVGAVQGMSVTSIKNTIFRNNTATEDEDGAGALFLGAISNTQIGNSVDNSLFENNTSTTRGGAISTRSQIANNKDASLDIINTKFTGNKANTTGGAFDNYFYNSSSNEGYVTVKGSEFTDNYAANGGAIYNHGELDKNNKMGSIKVENSIFKNNQAKKYGGAIYNVGNLIVENTVFEGNKASNGAAIATNIPSSFYKVSTPGKTEIGDGVQFLRNETTSHGGAIYIYDHSKLAHTFNIKDNVVFDGNVSGNLGGAIYTYLLSPDSEFTVGNNAIFTNNSAKKNAGAVYSGGKVTIGDNAKFTNNSAGYYGGAMYVVKDGLTLGNNAYFEANTAQQGGAIFISNAAVTIDNAQFVKNTAISDKGALGGAITTDKSNAKEVKILNSIFDSNSSQTTAGAIGQWDGSKATVTIENSTFTNNSAGSEAGAVNTDSTLIVKNSTFTGNKTTGTKIDEETPLNSDGGGGAVFLYDNGQAQISDSTFENNSSGTYGGAISTRINSTTGNLEVKNSKFINNTANLAGGAIANMKGGIAKIINSIFSGNTANGEKNDIHNEGEVTFVGNNTLDGGIDGNGSTIVQDGANVDISNGKLVQDTVNVETNGSLITNVANTTVANGITNNGSVTFTGDGEINTALSGNGSLILTPNGTITLNNASLIDSAIPVTVTGGEFAIGNNITNFDNKLTMGDSILNLVNGVDNVISNLNVESGKEMKLAIDFNDKIETADTSVEQGDIVLNKIDIGSVTVNSTNTLSTTLGNKISYDKDSQLVNGNGSVNFVTFSQVAPNSAILTATKSTLNGAVADTSDQRVYNMDTSETVISNTTVGTLVIQGNGKTIMSDPTDVGGGIQIGAVGVNSGDLSFVDTNLDSIIVNDDNKGALTVNGESGLVIEAKNQDVTIQNTKGLSVNNAIYLNDEENGKAMAALIAHEGKSITIQDDIRSNHANNKILLQGDGDIHLNGVLDPATVDTTAANVYRNGYDEAITWNLNGGTVHYSKDAYLYDAAHHSTALMNTLNFNGGNLDLRNGAANTINLAALNLNASSNLYLDVDLANKTMDRFEAPVTVNGGTLNVAGLQLLSDSVNPETTINFTTDEALKGSVQYTGAQGLQALSPIYKYNVKYLADSGDFNFVRNVAPNPYQSYNPAIYGSSVAMQGVYTTQLANYDIAFSNLDQKMLLTQDQRNALKYGNKYAANDESNPQVYSPLYIPEENAGVWFRPYASFEQVQLDNGPDVNNVLYGSLVGGDSSLIELGKGWDGQFSAYAGYNGSHQTFDGVGIYQNGGMVGVTAALYKGNFFEALTANFGANAADIKSYVGHNDLTMLATGLASKTGYNWELWNGKFIIQPSWTMSYTFISPLENYTLGNGVEITNHNLNAIQLAPGLKLIGNLPHGWQPYINMKMLWNIIDETKVKAEFINLPETSVKPYFEYGLGVQKMVGERFTGFGQAMFRAGGRNGVSFTLGGRYAIGELEDKHQIKSIKKSSRADRIKQISTDEN